MAVENPFGAVAGQMSAKIFSSILWFGVAGIAIAIVGGIMWYYFVYRKKFDITVKIKSERINDPKIYFDMGAILKDRQDGTKYLRLRDTRVDLPVPPFNIFHSTNKGDYVEIWRKSEDEFIFLVEGKIDKLKVVRQDGRVYSVAEQEQLQVEGDIAFWNVQRKGKNRSIFSSDSWLMKLMPYIPILLGGMIMIFMMYILMDNLPAILSQLQELVQALKSTTAAEVTTHQ